MGKGVDRAAVVAAAFEVLSEQGMDGLTLRHVAERLGIKAPTLYWHVKNKKDLVDEVSTELWRRIAAEVRAADATGIDLLRAFAVAMRRTILGVRDGARVFGGAYLTDTSLFGAQERVLEALLADGFTLRQATQAWVLVYSFALGFSIEEQEVAQAPAEHYDPATRQERIDAVRYPLVVEAGRSAHSEFDENFVEILDAVLGAVRAFGAPPGGASVS